jgi:hypothetical protein
VIQSLLIKGLTQDGCDKLRTLAESRSDSWWDGAAIIHGRSRNGTEIILDYGEGSFKVVFVHTMRSLLKMQSLRFQSFVLDTVVKQLGKDQPVDAKFSDAFAEFDGFSGEGTWNAGDLVDAVSAVRSAVRLLDLSLEACLG